MLLEDTFVSNTTVHPRIMVVSGFGFSTMGQLMSLNTASTAAFF